MPLLMPSITLKKRESPKKRKTWYDVVIDGQVFTDIRDPQDRFFWWHISPTAESGDEEMSLYLEKPELIEKFIRHSFNEIPKEIHFLAIDSHNIFDLDCELLRSTHHFSITRDPTSFGLYWAFLIKEELPDFFIGLYKHLLVDNYKVEVHKPTELSVHWPLIDGDRRIDETIAFHRLRFRRILDEISSSSESVSLTVPFDFEEPIKIMCQQYLLYFGQFLSDLGISAQTALTHKKAGEVLFTVTPTDRNQALDRIKRALDIYLGLASSNFTESNSDSIEVQRLESTIYRLRSDLKLAAAELQLKDATLRTQEVALRLINGEILTNSVSDESSKPDEKEDVIPGVLALSTYKEKGLEINLGELFRKLKKFLHSD